VLLEFSRRFLEWLDTARLEAKTKTYYRDGWRLLKATTIVGMRLDQVTSDVVETLQFSSSSSSANCALRTLRRMLHKGEEWKLIRQAPKVKLMKEYGVHFDLMMKRKGDCWRAQLLATGGNAAFNFSGTSLSSWCGTRECETKESLPDAH
jgi:hypothetical protein